MTSKNSENQTGHRDYYELIVNNMDEVAFIVDSDWNLDFANEAVLSYADLHLDAIEGEPIMDLTEQMVADSEDPEKFERALERVYTNDPDTEYPVTVELELALPAGNVTGEFRCSPDSVDDEVKAVVVSRDITEREQELQQQERVIE